MLYNITWTFPYKTDTRALDFVMPADQQGSGINRPLQLKLNADLYPTVLTNDLSLPAQDGIG
jgi:hypothetical protein